MMIAKEVAHVTITSYANPDVDEAQEMKSIQTFSRLLTEGYVIVCHAPVQTEGWCGVQYLLVKETEPGRARDK